MLQKSSLKLTSFKLARSCLIKNWVNLLKKIKTWINCQHMNLNLQPQLRLLKHKMKLIIICRKRNQQLSQDQSKNCIQRIILKRICPRKRKVKVKKERSQLNNQLNSQQKSRQKRSQNHFDVKRNLNSLIITINLKN